MHPYQNLRLLENLGQTIPNFDRVSFVKIWLDAGFESLEIYLENVKEKGKFAFGDELTLAEIFLVP